MDPHQYPYGYPQQQQHYYHYPPAPPVRPRRNWWRWAAAALAPLAPLALWQGSEAQTAKADYERQLRQTLYHTGRWQEVCRKAKRCDDCNLGDLCPRW